MRLVLTLSLLAPLPAHAHGLWGHIHVTGWAVENMPDGELRAMLLEPEVFNALLFGATFTDTGYSRDDSASRAYSEHTHWEPFVQDYVEWIRVNDPPPWTTLESKKRVAFLLGCASHGLQDELFDSLFLFQVTEHDGAGQDESDPGTDGFLALDDHLRFVPTEDMPIDMLLELYEGLDEEITEDVITESVDLVTNFYINDTIGRGVAEQLGEQYEELIPWTREHYLDAELPGSLRAEIYPTMHYQQAIWDRLHEGLDADAATVFAYPEEPRRLLTGVSTATSSWVSLVFGVGVRYEADLVELLDAEGAAVPFVPANSRWGPEFTRMVTLRPDGDLSPGAWYTARLRAGVDTIDGQVTDETWELTFQVECDTATAADCEDLGEVPEAHIDGLPAEDTGGEEDTDVTPAPVAADPETCGCATGAGAAPVSWVLLLGWLAGARTSRRTTTSFFLSDDGGTASLGAEVPITLAPLESDGGSASECLDVDFGEPCCTASGGIRPTECLLDDVCDCPSGTTDLGFDDRGYRRNECPS